MATNHDNHTEDDMATTAAHHISYWAKPNLYAADCAACDHTAKPGAGWTQKDRDSGKWVTYCHACSARYAKALPLISLDGYHVDAVNLADRKDRPGVYTCTTCRAHIALVKSDKGRWYFCDTRAAEVLHADSLGSDKPRCAPWEPHTCKHDDDREAAR